MPLELRGFFWDSASRWRLRGVELWRGLEYLGDLSAESLIHLIEVHLATAALHRAFEGELSRSLEEEAQRRPPVKLEARGAMLPDRMVRRRQRRTRRKSP